MDSYYFEYSDQSNSGYGLCGKVILRQNEIVFSAKHKCMDDITSITVSYNENIIEDVENFYHQYERYMNKKSKFDMLLEIIKTGNLSLIDCFIKKIKILSKKTLIFNICSEL